MLSHVSSRFFSVGNLRLSSPTRIGDMSAVVDAQLQESPTNLTANELKASIGKGSAGDSNLGAQRLRVVSFGSGSGDCTMLAFSVDLKLLDFWRLRPHNCFCLYVCLVLDCSLQITQLAHYFSEL